MSVIFSPGHNSTVPGCTSMRGVVRTIQNYEICDPFIAISPLGNLGDYWPRTLVRSKVGIETGRTFLRETVKGWKRSLRKRGERTKE